MKTLLYTSRTKEQLEDEFQTSLPYGLSSENVAAIKAKWGSNSFASQKLIWPTLLKRQFASTFIYLLAGCAIISFFLESEINAVIILCILLLNGLISFFQEYRASRSLELLKEHLELFCTVVRDGTPQRIPQKDIVPGDIVLLDAGNYVPGDVRIIQGEVMVNEAILSGESLPARKDNVVKETAAESMYQATNMAFFGTTIVAGSAHALVVSIGKETLSSDVGALSLQSIEESGFQERLTALSRFLLIVIGSTLPCLFLAQLLIKGSQVDVLELVLFSLALVIGLTPEALPTVTMFALSKGAVLLAKQNVIVKRLSAIEDLGSITVLCTDKTGTLTENKLSVASWYELPAIPLKMYSYLISRRATSDPFDSALVAATSQDDLHQSSLFICRAEQPFDTEKRSSAVLIEKDTRTTLIVRGAVEDILKKCSLPIDDAQKVWLAQQTREGNRVLALAYKNGAQSLDEEVLSLAGFVSFTDPVKPTAALAIKKAHELGIIVKMLTGDTKEVGAHIAQKIGLAQSNECAITGDEFDALSSDEQLIAVNKYSVFARCLPAQKYRLVKLLRKGSTVGFLGDGINDAPAMEAAHVGMVVQNASDSAKEAADIILLRKSLLAVIEGIGIGRNVFANTLKYIVTSISSNFGNFYSIAVAALFLDFLPLLPRQILLINLLSDFPMVAIATDTVDATELLKPPTFNIKGIALISLLLGLVSSLFDITFFLFFSRSQPALMQSAWFIENVLSEIVLIYSVRTHLPFFRARRPSAILIGLSFVAAVITIVLPFTSVGDWLFHFARPNFKDVIIVSTIVLFYFIVTDICKVAYFRYMNQPSKTG